ncbi:MAG: transposase [Acidobacteria bacterium]|nr:transposase [Acidobacteriota bacterium]
MCPVRLELHNEVLELEGWEAGARKAERAFRQWKAKWEPLRPRAVASVEHDLGELLNFFAVPQARWRKVRTTNVIERCFREVRRRTPPMSSFTNPAGRCLGPPPPPRQPSLFFSSHSNTSTPQGGYDVPRQSHSTRFLDFPAGSKYH